MLASSPIRPSWSAIRVAAASALLLVAASCVKDSHAAKLKYIKSAESFAAAGKWAEATVEYRNALQADPQAGEVRAKLADALVRAGDVSNATREYIRAADLRPDDTALQITAGNALLAAGKPEASLGLAQEAVKAETDNPDARLVLIRGLVARKDLQHAQAELDQLIARFPDSAAVQTQMGVLLGMKNDQLESRQHFEQALKLEPGSTEAFGGLVALDLAAKRPLDARARVEERLQRDGRNPSILMIAARTCAALGDKANAEAHLRRVLELDPGFLSAYGALAQLLVAQGRLDAAVVEFEQFVKRQPRSVASLTFVGMIKQSQGNVDAARDYFKRALLVDPEAPVAANNLAWIYAQSGTNLDFSLQLAQTAQRHLPDSPEVNDTVGFVYYKKGLWDLAIGALKASADKDPWNPTYQYHLGLAYAKAGEKANAQQHLSRALKLKSDFEGARDARGLLDSLGS